MSLELLKKSLKDAPVVKKGDYDYFVSPLTDGIPEIRPELLREVTCELKKEISKLGKIDKIVTIESMGIPIATALSLDLNIPFTVIRKRSYGFEDEICVDSKTGYSNCKLYINGIEKKDKIVIVDDVISTGGTLDSIVSTLEDLNVDIKGIFVIVQKKSKGKKSDLKIKSLITGQ